jgi:hypothetical protein
MKRLLYLIPVLFLLLTAQSTAQILPGVMSSSGASAPSGCNPAAGDKTVESGSYSGTNDIVICEEVIALCDGTLDKAYYYADGSGSGTANIGIYHKTGSVPGSGDTPVGISGNMSQAGGWQNASFASGSLVNETHYWMCMFSDVAWATKKAGMTTVYWQIGTGFYASPPANLGAVGPSTGSFGPTSIYVTTK